MQEFRVLRCVECEAYQVDIIKKAKKWTCKVCSMKQSVKYVYFTSNAASECRQRVEELRTNFCQSRAAEEDALLARLEGEDEDGQVQEHQERDDRFKQFNYSTSNSVSTQSKWSKFKEANEEDELFKSQSESNLTQNTDDSKSTSCSTPTNNSRHSNFHQASSPALNLVDFHNRQSVKKSKCRPAEQSDLPRNEPLRKKAKLLEDDLFELSQDDWNRLDGLQ